MKPSEQYRDWATTVSPLAWKKISLYIDEAEEHTELKDYPSVTSWKEMVTVLTLYESTGSVHERYDSLIEDYKSFIEATKGMEYGW